MVKENFEEVIFASNYLEVFISEDYVSLGQRESFASVLKRYILDSRLIFGMKQSDISRITGIESTTITKYTKGERKPTLNAIILLSLAMKLTPDRSENLLFTAGYQLNNSIEHRIYKFFLYGCAFNP